MSVIVQFQIPLEDAKDDLFLQEKIAQELNLNATDFTFKWRKRSIDARKRQIKINASFEVFLNGEVETKRNYFEPQKVNSKNAVAIIGAGPAGLFAALRAIEKGLKPVIFERGKDVRARREIWRN